MKIAFICKNAQATVLFYGATEMFLESRTEHKYFAKKNLT